MDIIIALVDIEIGIDEDKFGKFVRSFEQEELVSSTPSSFYRLFVFRT
jgi:hypothetical protein